MIVFGWGSGAKRLGDGFILTCANCHNTGAFSVVEASKKFTLYWLPVVKWDKTYFHICPVCSHGIQIPNRELAQRILAGAFRDPYQPTPALAQALRQAFSLNNSSSVSEESESFDDSLNRGQCAEYPTEVLVNTVLKSESVVDFRPSVQVLEPESKPPQETEAVRHSSSRPQYAAVNSGAVTEAMNRPVTSEPTPVVRRVEVADTDRRNAELSKNVVPGSTESPAGFDLRDGEKSIDDLRQAEAESKNHNERWWVTLSVVGGCSIFLVLLIAIIATPKNQKRNEDTSRSYTPYSNGTATRGRQDEAQQTASELAKITPTILDTDAQQQIINKWVTENDWKLFTSTGELTSFGNLYQQFEIAIDEQTPNCTLLERHQEVLKRIALAEQASSITKTREGNRYYKESLYQEAIAAFEQAIAADPKNPTPKNNLARLLGTCPDSAFRDGNRAVRLAVEANRESNDGDWKTMCVVAAAYAETGDFTSATNWVQKAQRLGEADRAITKGLLTQFRNREPCRW